MRPRIEEPACPDPAAFEVFYRTTVQRTFELVRRVAAGDKHLAGDATQDAYVEMLRRWPQRRTCPLADNQRYVFGIAIHKVRDWYRARGRFVELAEETSHVRDTPAVQEMLDELALLQGVRDIIARQPPRQRLVAVMYFLEDYKCAEIAEVLGITASTVRTHVQRTREILKPYVNQTCRDDQEGESS